MRKPYPSDVTREQFEWIKDKLEANKKRTRPRKHDLYEIFCAVLYILKEGCTFRALPHDFPKWEIVYYYYSCWTKIKDNGKSLIDELLIRMVMLERQAADGRNPKTTMVIIDSKTIDNADTAKEKGYDGGKKISGVKIHVAVDTNGLPHAVGVTTANVSDRDGAIQMFEKNADNLTRVQKVLGDGGYTGKPFSDSVKIILGDDVEVEIVKRSEMHKFVVIPKRWIVERSFAWLEKCRRLWKNCERKIHNTLQMVSLAFMGLILRRFFIPYHHRRFEKI